MRYLFILLLCLAGSFATQAGAVEIGDIVTCSAVRNFICKNDATTATVKAGSEFEIDYVGSPNPKFSVDFSNDMLTLTALSNFSVANGAINTLTFGDLTHPITGITSFSIVIPPLRGTTVTQNDFSVANGAITMALAGISTSNGVVFKIGLASAAPAPEPLSWSLMIFGFGGVGAMLRRRRRVSVSLT